MLGLLRTTLSQTTHRDRAKKKDEVALSPRKQVSTAVLSLKMGLSNMLNYETKQSEQTDKHGF